MATSTESAPPGVDLAGPDPRRAHEAARDLHMAHEWIARLEAELHDAQRLRDVALSTLAAHTLPPADSAGGPAVDADGVVLEPEEGVVVERLAPVKRVKATVKPGGLKRHHEALEPLGLHEREETVPATVKTVRPSVSDLRAHAAKLRSAGVPLDDLVDEGQHGPPRFRLVIGGQELPVLEAPEAVA